MARATYIYHAYYDEPFATFTVKHELVTWLENNEDIHTGLKVTRTADGRMVSKDNPTMPAAEFLANGGKF